jgi:beta-phosphoglucomutase-like phosphatase (HAD superfamily)
VEDSEVGIRAALAGGLSVIAIPNRAFPPSEEILGGADLVLGSITELDADRVIAAASRRTALGAADRASLGPAPPETGRPS